jgi:DNA-binding beta-propeller fold protein YncE
VRLAAMFPRRAAPFCTLLNRKPMADKMKTRTALSRAVLCGTMTLSSFMMTGPQSAWGAPKSAFLPNGLFITPTAAPNSTYQALNPGLSQVPNFIADGAFTTAVSPDGKTLLVLTGGYNDIQTSPTTSNSNEYIFVFDISKKKPVLSQVIQQAHAFVSIVWAPNGNTFYVGGGSDDSVVSYQLQSGQWAVAGTPIALGFTTAYGLYSGDYPALTGGLATSADGTVLVATDYENDSVSFLSVGSNGIPTAIESTMDLRPGKLNPADSGVPGGEYPFWVTVLGNNVAYISAARDREIDVVSFSTPSAPTLVTRIKTAGNPLKSILDSTQSYLYVAEDNSDLVEIITTSTNTLFQSAIVSAPDESTFAAARHYKGSAPNSLAFSPDGSMLYVTLGGANAVSVVTGIPAHPTVTGLIPTGYYPNSISLSNDGKYAYVADGKGLTGPNPGETYYNGQPNQYVEQLQKSYLHSFPIPSATELAKLTKQVAQNDHYGYQLTSEQQKVISFLQQHIKHVIYLVKENRTYDQILGDLPIGNGDPSLVDFGQTITPNYHTIAQQFVDLDNYYVPGDVSGDGLVWSFAGRENDLSTKSIPGDYSVQGEPYDSEGQNRDINMGFATNAERVIWEPIGPTDPDILPGTRDVGAVDGPDAGDFQTGYIWDTVLRAGLKVRNYGYDCDESEYFAVPTPLTLYPSQVSERVSFPSRAELMPTSVTDPYFRSFDNNFPDWYREWEWEREFKGYVKHNNLPALQLVRFMHDHMGSFGTAIEGVNTPEYQQADNDYATAKLIEAVAKSPYASDTLIIAIEDDSQDGADHVDSHRSTIYIAGPYVKQGAVISTPYTTVNLITTIEDILGVDHIDALTASAAPMTDVFDTKQVQWDFKAVPSSYLYNTQLPLPPQQANAGPIPKATHDAAYWARVTKEFNFAREDNIKDVNKFNRIIWEGLHGSNVPYPTARSGADLRQNRALILKKSATAKLGQASNN